jgi:hypothetical protein
VQRLAQLVGLAQQHVETFLNVLAHAIDQILRHRRLLGRRLYGRAIVAAKSAR